MFDRINQFLFSDFCALKNTLWFSEQKVKKKAHPFNGFP
jgi:hypothetical protein